MLTSEGCRARRQRFLDRLKPTATLLLSDPVHLRYLANFHVDPFHFSGDQGGLLLLRPDGQTILWHDNKLPGSVKQAHVDEVVVVPWYDGLSPGRGVRKLLFQEIVKQHGGRIHDDIADPQSRSIIETLADLRRRKDPDEIVILKQCMRATEVGHAWARQHVRAGLTELDVYCGVAKACQEAAGQPAIVYGDFAVSPGPVRRGGPPTNQVLADSDMFIIDYSVVLWGYRSDFTNTLVVGGRPNPEQKRLYDLCVAAMAAGERELRGGASCLTVYGAVNGVFARVGLADSFPHHAGHGLGLTHPENPYIVRTANETLQTGDVVTLEPGLYLEGIGGIRIEHNYLISDTGFERLSNHEIALA
jgi:Xaa-Pro aminopeptidase